MIISKQELVDNINKEISDNSKGNITPSDIRHNLLDVIDSVHNLTGSANLTSLNFDTIKGSRTTRIGNFTLDNFRRDINGYTSVDNTVVGYASLSKNFSGHSNTSVGSYALNCNIHGHNNVAYGFNAIAANTTGYGNVGIGNYSLHDNKIGNLNIAIGHGAGYYVDRDTNNKLFIGSHNVDKDYICSNPEGTGLIPLIQGDLDQANLRLGIGVTGLTNAGMLQLGGSIVPQQTTNYNIDLGTNTNRFRDVYLSDTLYFSESNKISYRSDTDDFLISAKSILDGDVDVSGTLDVSQSLKIGTSVNVGSSAYVAGTLDVDDKISVSGDIIPKTSKKFRLGTSEFPYLSADIFNINVLGSSKFNKFEAVEQAHYLHKTIFLASSGYINTLDGGGASSLTENYHPNQNLEPPIGYLKDEELSGAGLNIYSKDVAAGYDRTYLFQFRPQDSTLSNLVQDDVFSRSHWFSNISISTAKGKHVKTDRVLSNSKLGLVNYVNGQGVFVDINDISFGNESEILAATDKSGFGDVNFVSNSGTSVTDYNISYISLKPDVNIHQKWLTNTESNNFRGFEQSYITKEALDAPEFFNPQSGQTYDRFVIKGYKDSAYPTRNFMLMADGNDGFVGINNFSRGEYLTPDTILNIRSSGDAVVRIAAENSANTKAGVQLLTTANCLTYGVDIHYHNTDKELNIDFYHNDVKTKLLKASVGGGNKYVGLFNEDDANNSMLTMGNLQNNTAAISMYEHNAFESATESYGKFFVKKVDRDAQKSVLNYVDSAGNYFEVNMRAIDIELGSNAELSIFADNNRNTLAGVNSPLARANITTAFDNTTYGNSAFSGITTGDYNVIIGSKAGQSALGTKSNNTLIGYNAGNSSSLGDDNLIIGSNVKKPTFTLTETNNILIDDVVEVHKDMATSYGTCNKVYLKDSSLTLTNGRAGQLPNNKIELEPYEGSFDYTPHVTNTENQDFDFKVKGSPILNLSRGSTSFANRTFADDTSLVKAHATRVHGNVKVDGSLMFGDGSAGISSSSFLGDISTLQSNVSSNNAKIATEKARIDNINADLSSLFVEGYTKNGALPPDDATSPTTCVMSTRIKSGSSWIAGQDITLTNRDKFLRISKNDYIVAVRINGEYRPLFVSYGS